MAANNTEERDTHGGGRSQQKWMVPLRIDSSSRVEIAQNGRWRSCKLHVASQQGTVVESQASAI